MFHKLLRMMLLSFITVFAAGTLAVAVEKQMSGTITNIDEDSGVVVLKMADGKKRQISASGAQLSELSVGDNVEIVTDKGAAKSIRKTPAQ